MVPHLNPVNPAQETSCRPGFPECQLQSPIHHELQAAATAVPAIGIGPDRPDNLSYPLDTATLRWTAPGAQPHWKTEEPESLAAIEASVRQVARGALDLTIDGVIQYVEGCRARLNDDL